jgi:FkbM family methyltransferase
MSDLLPNDGKVPRLRQAFTRVVNPAIGYLYRLVRQLPSDWRAAGADAAPSATFSLSYDGTSFKVYLVEGRYWAYRAFSMWADGKEIYERVMLECLSLLLRETEHPSFMDVGAFMGHYACYAAALLGDKAETYAVESNPRYYSAILRSIELNRFTRVKTFNVVLSDRAETAAIDEQAVLFFEPGGTRAQSMTLDDLCRREGIRPTIVKIDVHGSEGKVLMGMQEVMNNYLEYILLELSPAEILRKYSGDISSSDILMLLERLGFHVFYVAGHRYEGWGSKQAQQPGFAYRRLDSSNRDLLLFDRPIEVFLLCSKKPDLEGVLGPSVADPGLGLSIL